MLALKNNIQKLLRTHRATFAVWMVLPIFLFGTYHLFSDGDFSFLLTAGAIVRAFAFVLLGIKMFTENSARDVSQKAMIVYVVAFGARLLSVTIHEGYLPFDHSGDHVYKIAELTSFIMAGACLYMSKTRDSYNSKADCFGNMSFPRSTSPVGVMLILVPCLVLALAVHPSLNSFFFTDVSWTYACYLETFAVVPQLMMIRSSQTKGSNNVIVEPYTAHWMFSLAIARAYMLFFWMYTYHELHGEEGGLCGFAVLGFQALQLVFMMEYMYYYIRSAAKGEEIRLPGYNYSV